ncbi:toll/interleukin-1 receptor domain-containing protein [Variovorax sp. J22R115]|uniref:toll/interleukin-1 receptor domain-containing protein n=1 Tax=Variovorax sp. J22R115 TaxID=3053509 RepID=UPI0025753527|nr:toll/interleukin-1 receptor domain-containing protein [Variovorax sp. J22R115]MDM0053038.1 toll/interleukin-1 receptor domain-containing protein [Variovorax sp. J22R115]
MTPTPAVLDPMFFKSLASKVLEGDCVLVLGPRISAPQEVSEGDEPMDEYLAARLLAALGADKIPALDLRAAIARYEREKSASACRNLVQGLAGGFDDYSTALQRKLAKLPFRLVLAATSDRTMAKAFAVSGKPGVQEAYYDYCRGVAADHALRLPSADEPIVYNLFGRHDHPESMVLNDKNLLDYLVKITRESPPLPDVVRATLRAPSTVFLFIGFGFRNWWLRLLLKVLEIIGVENRSLSLALEDGKVFDAAASSEHRGFFESVGIFVQASDWNVLADDLVTEIGRREAAKALVPVLAAPASVAKGRPLVFLSYASEDVDKVDMLRISLQGRGLTVWQDRQNLRAGQNWEEHIDRMIKGVDYFVFVQTEAMDRRDRTHGGVYNMELKQALVRVKKLPYGSIFLLHVTMGQCRERPEPQLSEVHRISVDSEAGRNELATAIMTAYLESRGEAPPLA